MRASAILSLWIATITPAFSGNSDVDPSVIVHSCNAAWCEPVVAAFKECEKAGRPGCLQDDAVKRAHHRALGRYPPAEQADIDAKTASERETRLAGKTRFMGYALTMSMNDAKSIQGTSCQTQNNTCHRNAGGRFIFLQFFAGQLYSVIIETKGDDDFVELVGMLNEKYGKAGRTKSTKVLNRMGVAFDKVNFTWTLPDGEITATNIVSRVDEGLITFHDPKIGRQALREARSKQTNVFD